MKRKDRTEPPTGPEQPVGGREASEPRSAVTEQAAQRLATIVEAAERAAEQVIDDAERQAREKLTDAYAEAERVVAERLAAAAVTAETLIARAEAIRAEADGLISTLRQARSELDGEARAPTPPGAPAAVPELGPDQPLRGSHLTAVPFEKPPAVPPAPAPDPDPGPPGSFVPPVAATAAEVPLRSERNGSAAGARLLATQMAVSGSSREEIAERLRNGFEIDDTDAILDAILGPEEAG